jgi:hypothetical protein
VRQSAPVGDLGIHAVAGTHAELLAWNSDESKRSGQRGFGIKLPVSGAVPTWLKSPGYLRASYRFRSKQPRIRATTGHSKPLVCLQGVTRYPYQIHVYRCRILQGSCCGAGGPQCDRLQPMTVRTESTNSVSSGFLGQTNMRHFVDGIRTFVGVRSSQ